MIAPIEIILAAGFGGLLGIFYFGGLWWTVRLLLISRHPIAIYFGSLASRLTVAVLGISFLAIYFRWQLPVAGLLGFMAARSGFARYVGREPMPETAAERVRR